ncbi:PhnD/SsuA/transferrin family substrate-binding protein [Pseudomonas sp. dw_358]|uniref:phosphate/phosphite/phosphonate ABC transporter substrate-binding protein n=1 Tax=Pseudomonas sp. dw_358 TaxID=2720083 RepID=UPI001BD42FBB|nr:PhnD/SsuA/transferrin family substrate-binding protein [Pseudomonas sp. dw_358]
MNARYAELPMYVAPYRVRMANDEWLELIAHKLGVERLPAAHLSLPMLWQDPRLLLSQTCGYPLMTLLKGKVRLIGRPCYEFPDSGKGQHCSLFMARADDPRQDLADFAGSCGVINGPDSNTGMNLLRHSLAPLQHGGQFFSSLQVSGGHRESLRWLREARADLASVDSVTFAYLARDASHEVVGLRTIGRSAASPTLPYITGLESSAEQAEEVRAAMNQSLRELPEVAQILGISEVLAASEADYEILLAYERQAATLGLEHLHAVQ